MDANRLEIGVFDSGHDQMMQLWGDGDGSYSNVHLNKEAIMDAPVHAYQAVKESTQDLFTTWEEGARQLGSTGSVPRRVLIAWAR